MVRNYFIEKDGFYVKKTHQKGNRIFLATIMAIGASMPVSAYVKAPYRHKINVIYYYYDNWAGMRAISFYAKGASAWKSKTTEATISQYNSSHYDVYFSVSQNPNVAWDGLTSTTIDGSGYVVRQSMCLNQSSRAWNDDGALQSVVVHEMGHVFGLKENGYTKTIMNSYTYGANSRYGTYKLTTPQTDDKNGVNAIY